MEQGQPHFLCTLPSLGLCVLHKEDLLLQKEDLLLRKGDLVLHKKDLVLKNGDLVLHKGHLCAVEKRAAFFSVAEFPLLVMPHDPCRLVWPRLTAAEGQARTAQQLLTLVCEQTPQLVAPYFSSDSDLLRAFFRGARAIARCPLCTMFSGEGQLARASSSPEQ